LACPARLAQREGEEGAAVLASGGGRGGAAALASIGTTLQLAINKLQHVL
jgi:hypothetical protein